MLQRRITQVVTVGVFAVAAFWLLLVILLFAQFAPGTNAIGASVEPSATTTIAAPVTTTSVAEVPATTTTAQGDDVVEEIAVVELEDTTIAYRVERGDTLSEIGARFGYDWQTLAAINDLDPPYVIGIGRIIQVPDESATGGAVSAAVLENPSLAELDAVFDEWALVYDVPAELSKSTAFVVSGWDPLLEGDSRAAGVGQLLPEVQSFVEDDIVGESLDPTDPSQSVQAMTAYLGWLLEQTQGDTSASLAAYRQGLLSTRNIGWEAETVQFIAEVIALRPEFVA